MNIDIEKFFNYKGIDIEDIPNIPLYMDQLLGFFDERLAIFKLDEEDKLLTKTMVNNYVKAEIIDPPVKKKYDKDQLMMLAMIFHIKNILSIHDLKDYFDLQKSKDGKGIKEIYKKFISIEETQFNELKEEYGMFIEETIDNDKLLDSILHLIIEANLKKRLAEMLLKQFTDDKPKKESK